MPLRLQRHWILRFHYLVPRISDVSLAVIQVLESHNAIEVSPIVTAEVVNISDTIYPNPLAVFLFRACFY